MVTKHVRYAKCVHVLFLRTWRIDSKHIYGIIYNSLWRDLTINMCLVVASFIWSGRGLDQEKCGMKTAHLTLTRSLITLCSWFSFRRTALKGGANLYRIRMFEGFWPASSPSETLYAVGIKTAFFPREFRNQEERKKFT